MKTFQDYLSESDEDFKYDENDYLTEANNVSNHRRTPTEMAMVHKSVLKMNNHHIVHHETNGDGSHTIVHVTPKKKVRVSTVKPVHSGPNKSEIHDRPGTSEEQTKYGPK